MLSVPSVEEADRLTDDAANALDVCEEMREDWVACARS